jgi:predicted N-acetyltransferase YhbS
MKNQCIIRHEEKTDYEEVENLVRESFWNVYRPGCMEHYVLHCFRDDSGFIPELDYVMELEGKIIGHIMYSRSEIKLDKGGVLPAITLGPVCVAPEYRGRGHGKMLINTTLEAARGLGYGAVILEGNIKFYGRCGFTRAKDKGVRYAADPEADYLLCLELTPGYLEDVKGTFTDPDGYSVCQKDPEGFEKFEAGFPYREKKKLPGQLQP